MVLLSITSPVIIPERCKAKEDCGNLFFFFFFWQLLSETYIRLLGNVSEFYGCCRAALA